MKKKLQIKKWAGKTFKVFAALIAFGLAMMLNMPTLETFAERNWDRPDITVDYDGELNAPIFNSMTDTPFAQVCGGTEKNFVMAKLVSPSEGAWECNDVPSVKDGDIYEVSVLVHNNVNTDWNKEQGNPWEWTIAKGVTVNVNLPTGLSKSQTLTGTIRTSEESNPNHYIYMDDVIFTSSEDFKLEFVPGSAHYVNGKGDFPISDSVVGNNTEVGYESMNGEVPGCRTYSGHLYFKVKVKMEDKFSVKKEVRVKGNTGAWKSSVTVKTGEEVEFRVTYKNEGATTINGVVLKDSLPANFEYVADSAKIYVGTPTNTPGSSAVAAVDFKKFTSSGITSDFGAGTGTYIIFTAKAKSEGTCGTEKATNTASAVFGGKTEKSSATVKIEKECPKPICEKVEEGGKVTYYDENGEETTVEVYTEQCVEPEPTTPPANDCVSNPNLPECQTIPNTGPAEAIFAAIVIIGISGGGFYYYYTHRAVKKVKDSVSGKTAKKEAKKG
ncbi:MAG: hypothetical protein Q4A79_01200 [Candidatus Saccharibacteria bacterium]|nr:hypothetical protein [Candidatus Saccharibacteria bacterium]